MIAKVCSYGISGIKGYGIEIEADINSGLPSMETVGLPDAQIKESKERVRSAVKNSFFGFPAKKITVNLAPADTKKVGTFYDLPIAVCILAASGQLECGKIEGFAFLGELALDGRVRRINGILPMLIAAAKDGLKKIVVPKENEAEAGFVRGVEVFAVSTLSETVAFLNGEAEIPSVAPRDALSYINTEAPPYDFCFIKGQYRAKRAMEIAAAGGHNVLLIGPPGAGKTMLARALPGILPDMTADEALEITKIHSVAGLLDPSDGIVTKRPFRTPHHTSTMIALTGGGGNAKPGEISLAHRGVLYLDELPEYNRHTLEALRQPLEDGVITISRNNRTVIYPAEFMLAASMNPCPCGYYGSKKNTCKCAPSAIAKYVSKLSGPLIDRIDLHIEAEDVEFDDLNSAELSEPSAKVKERVDKARARQLERFRGSGVFSNAKMSPKQMLSACRLDPHATNLLKAAFSTLRLSARAHNRILKVSRTIADLEGAENIETRHLAEAVQYRSLDKKYDV